MRILLRDFVLLTPAEERGAFQLVRGCSLALAEGRIERITQDPKELEPAQARFDFDKVIDGGGRKLLMPGLVNAHTHLAMVLFRGYADDLPLDRWLEEAIWPAERELTAEEVYWGSLLGLAELIRSGTTAIADMYFFMDEVARAVEQSGLRALLAYGMIAPDPDPRERLERELERGLELAERWHGKADGRIRVALGPHAPYTCTDELWQRAVELARERELMIHTHLAETAREVEDFRARRGLTPVEHLERLGVFEAGVGVLAAHGVHLSESDICILAKYNNVAIVHNPTSNMKLGSGIAPVKELLEAGVELALGTDGAASNNNLDLLEEVRLAALLQKVRGDPTALPAAEALWLGTLGGARALGLEEVGIIREGMKADLIVLDLDQPHLIPEYDLVSNLVYAASSRDVETVIVDGQVVMEDRKILSFDEAEAKDQVRRLSEKYRKMR